MLSELQAKLAEERKTYAKLVELTRQDQRNYEMSQLSTCFSTLDNVDQEEYQKMKEEQFDVLEKYDVAFDKCSSSERKILQLEEEISSLLKT